MRILNFFVLEKSMNSQEGLGRILKSWRYIFEKFEKHIFKGMSCQDSPSSGNQYAMVLDYSHSLRRTTSMPNSKILYTKHESLCLYFQQKNAPDIFLYYPITG